MRALMVAALVLAACSDPDPPAEVIPVEEPEQPGSGAIDEAEPDVTPEPSEEAPTALELPDEIPPPVQLPMREERGGDSSTWPVIAHPDPEVRAVLASTIAGVASEIEVFADGGAQCFAPLANEHLVSVICIGHFATRGGTGTTTAELHLAIASGEVRPFVLADAFLPGFELGRFALDRCETDRDRRLAGMTEEEAAYDQVPDQCDIVTVLLARRGLQLHVFDLNSGVHRPIDVPFADFREHIRSDGPLAPVLTDRPARIETVSEQDATGWAVTAFGSEPALVRRWMDVDPASAAGLVVEDFGGGLARLVRPHADSEPARLVARALGAEATPIRLGESAGGLPQIEWDDWWTRPVERAAHTIRWLRTTEDLNLRQRTLRPGRTGAVIAVLPAGSLVAAVGGVLRQAGQYVRVVTTLGAGQLASRHLRAHDGCVIAPGESARHLARVQIRDHGSSRDAWLVISRRDRGSHIALRERDDGCELGDEVLGVDVDRPAFDVRLTATDARGGTSLLLVGTGRGRSAPSEVRYRAYRVGSRGAVLDETFELTRNRTDLAVRLGESSDDAYFPVTLEHSSAVHRYAWADGVLREQPAPD